MQFFIVYITEAHAIDGRAPDRSGSVVVEEPVSLEERVGIAQVCVTKMELEGMPAVVDRMDDRVGAAYAGHPDRLYLVGRDGKIAYRGGPGPFGFDPDELEQAIQKELGITE